MVLCHNLGLIECASGYIYVPRILLWFPTIHLWQIWIFFLRMPSLS